MKNESLSNKLLHTILSIAAITLFLKTPVVGGWINYLVLPNWQNLKANLHTDLEDRKLARWGNTYYASMYIKQQCEENNIKNAVILFEPNAYYKAINFDFKAPEPIIFYYFTGIRGVWMSSKHIDEATHFVTISKGEIIMYEIIDHKMLARIQNRYKEYRISL